MNLKENSEGVGKQPYVHIKTKLLLYPEETSLMMKHPLPTTLEPNRQRLPRPYKKHSHPNSSGFQNPITFPTKQTGRIVDSHDIWLIQNTYTFQGLRNEDPLHHVKHYLSIVDNIQADGATRDTSRLRFFHFSLKGKAVEWLDRIPPTQMATWDQLVSRFLDHFFPDDRRKLDQLARFRFDSLIEEEGWNLIEEYAQYQDDLWDSVSPLMNISSILEAMQPTFRGRLKRTCDQISYLETPTREVYLSGGDIYDDPSLLRFYQNDDTPPWGNNKRKEKGEDGPEWIVRSKFEDELANFMLEKKAHAKGIGDMLVQHRKELHKQYSQILSTINKSETPEPEAPTFAITTRLGISTRDPPFPAPPRPTTDNFTEGETKKEGPEGVEPSIVQEPTPRPSILYQPSKSSNLPFPSRLKKQKKDDEDERLLSIFKQIHINLPFLEAMIHMPKEAKVLKDLLLHKEKLKKAGSSVKLSEECSAIIQRKEEGDDSNEVLAVSFYPRTEPVEPLEWKAPENRLKPSSVEPPKLELKELLEHLELLEVLWNHKVAIAWSITDIKGIDSSFCTHKILMEDEFKPSFQPQRRVNPNIKEVVKKEVIKLLDAGLIYPISNSPWVSPVQVIPKKGGMTVVKNEKDEPIPQRTVTGWRVCIDYRKLNNAARKDHFPLPFIDQMLERLARHEYYCFLDGFSGYFQIPIAPEDQEKTTFTCPYGTFAYKLMPFGLCNAPATF
ncbi:reverse transcriptase domain-containing protein [Tanacetum coccineum]